MWRVVGQAIGAGDVVYAADWPIENVESLILDSRKRNKGCNWLFLIGMLGIKGIIFYEIGKIGMMLKME